MINHFELLENIVMENLPCLILFMLFSQNIPEIDLVDFIFF